MPKLEGAPNGLATVEEEEEKAVVAAPKGEGCAIAGVLANPNGDAPDDDDDVAS